MGEGFPHWKTGAGQPGLGRLAPEARSVWGRRNHQTGSPNGATNRSRQAEPSDGGGGFGPVGAGVFAQRVRQRDKVQIQRIREAGHRHAERGAGEAAGDAPRDQRGYEDGAVFEGDVPCPACGRNRGGTTARSGWWRASGCSLCRTRGRLPASWPGTCRCAPPDVV